MESVLLRITAHVKSVGKEPFATFVSLCLAVFMEHVLRLLNVNVTMAGQEAIVTYVSTEIIYYLDNQRQITLRIVCYHFSSRLTATLNLCLIYFKIT